MDDDGLMPKFVSKVHQKFRTPWITTILTGVVVAFFGAILPIRDAASLVSIGTLLAFVIVSIGVLVLRVREPELPRKFKAPIVWFVAPMGALSALYLMISLPWRTWERLLIWFVIGMVVFLLYRIRRSNPAQPRLLADVAATAKRSPGFESRTDLRAGLGPLALASARWSCRAA